MKAIYALLFGFISFQALAGDLDEMNAPTMIDYYAEIAVTAPPAISSEDELFDHAFVYSSIDQDLTREATASIPETAPIQITEYDLNAWTVDDMFAY